MIEAIIHYQDSTLIILNDPSLAYADTAGMGMTL